MEVSTQGSIDDELLRCLHLRLAQIGIDGRIEKSRGLWINKISSLRRYQSRVIPIVMRIFPLLCSFGVGIYAGKHGSSLPAESSTFSALMNDALNE